MTPTKVYVLEHDDRMYEMGDCYVRGIYATREKAEAELPLKVRDGNARNARILEEHTDSCCSVEEWDVEA